VEFEKFFNPIDGFPFEALEDDDFREDSVREEIIVPIVKALGYSVTPPNKIIRSKPLEHPFISVGSARKKVMCIPDYLFEVDGKYAWVLEAKSPTENILSGKHVEQTYSYAIHSEIRVPLFALCNGKEFVLFSISDPEPILHFDLRSTSHYFPNLKKHLSPVNVHASGFKLAKDFGLHLKRLGFHDFQSIIFPAVPILSICQLDPDQFTINTGIKSEEGDNYVMSFDFGEKVLLQFQGKIPDQAIKLLLQRKPESRQQVQFPDGAFLVTIDCRVGTELQENKNEIFLPFIINRVL
jgi:hypothetical protein